MDLKLVLEAAEVERLIMLGFGAAEPFFKIEELRVGLTRVRMPFRKWMLRPGNTISGPALFTAADLAMYALVLGHAGPELMAVTSDMNLHFLSKGQAADVVGEARLLKLGRRLAVMEVSLSCGDDPRPVAHVTGSYSLPPPGR